MSSPPLPEPFVKRVHLNRLTEGCIRALAAVGMSEHHAGITANHLIRTDMRGIYTHGTVSLRQYAKQMRDGGLDPRAEPQITTEGPAWAQIDARQAVGMVAGHTGMQAAIAKAQATGIGMAGVRHSNHFGAASAYTLMAAEANLIGIAMSNTDVVMNIPGGRGAMIGNNPLSYAIPAGDQPAMVLDIAMSTVAGGKVKSAQDRGMPLPQGWLTDREGLPTTDPNVFTVEGALTPFAGHKGYGIALLVESLAGVLAGAGMTSDILSWPKDASKPCNEGHSFIAIDVGAMMPRDEFHTRMDELITRMKDAPKAKGSDRTYVPGEMEWECEQAARTFGIPLTQMALDNLQGLGEDTGVDLEL